MSSLEEFLRERELQKRPFPIWALLILYEKSNPRDTYVTYYEGFRLLVEWLNPIQLTPHSEPIPKLHRSYKLQEIAYILQTSDENLYHAYITALNILELTKNGYTPTETILLYDTHAAFVPSQVSAVSSQCARK